MPWLTRAEFLLADEGFRVEASGAAQTESATGGARPRAADDFDTIRMRLQALRRGCTCTIFRHGDGSVHATERDPACVLHGGDTPSGMAGGLVDDPCRLACEMMQACDAVYRARGTAELEAALEHWRALKAVQRL